MKSLAGSAGRQGFKGLAPTLALICSLVTMAASVARAQSTVALSGNHPAAVPAGWSPAAEAKQLALTAVVALRNPGELAQLIHDLQDRHASRYHQWMTTDQFVARFGPTPEQMSAVVNWLKSRGFEVTSSDRRTRRVNFTATVGSAGQAFGIGFVGDGTSYANTADRSAGADDSWAQQDVSVGRLGRPFRPRTREIQRRPRRVYRRRDRQRTGSQLRSGGSLQIL